MEERERNLVMILGVSLALAFAWYWVIPTYNRYVKLEDKIESNVKQVRSAQRKASQLEQLVDKLKGTKKELKAAKQKLPEKGRFNELMSTLEQQARASGIDQRKIVEFNRGSKNKLQNGLVRELTIKTRFQNISMGQMIEMLWRFDKLVRMVDVNNFQNHNLQITEDGEGFRFNLNLNLSVYIFEEPTESSQEGESA